MPPYLKRGSWLVKSKKYEKLNPYNINSFGFSVVGICTVCEKRHSVSALYNEGYCIHRRSIYNFSNVIATTIYNNL
jgi:hypothetical protein